MMGGPAFRRRPVWMSNLDAKSTKYYRDEKSLRTDDSVLDVGVPASPIITSPRGYCQKLFSSLIMTDYFERASDFKVKHRRGEHKSAITALKFSQSQEFLASSDDDGRIVVR